MATYGDMQSRIANEIKRSDLTTQIQNAIKSAIQAHESRPFWFTQGRATMTTTAGVKVYALPSTPTEDIFKKMRRVRIYRNGWLPLEEFGLQEALEYDVNTSQTGVPDHYFIEYLEKTTPANDHATIGQMWLLPIPDASYSVELHYFKELDPLTANSSENAWTDEAELLIRCRAKRELYTHVIRDTNEALKWAAAEQSALSDLQRRGAMARGPGRIVANW